MAILRWFFWGAIFVAMLGFALSNTTNATLRFFGSNLEWSAPVVVHLLTFFIGGAIFGLLAVVPAWYRGKRSISKLEREMRKMSQELKAFESRASTATPVSPIATIDLKPDLGRGPGGAPHGI
jgi:lipopolysaccharide assembly protein A